MANQNNESIYAFPSSGHQRRLIFKKWMKLKDKEWIKKCPIGVWPGMGIQIPWLIIPPNQLTWGRIDEMRM
jgi:hypothetical protein